MEPSTRIAPAPSALGRLKAYAALHKFWSAIVIAVVVGGGYYGYGALTAKAAVTSYVTTTVATGTVVAALSETGQVSATQQLGLSPKASGEVVGVYVKDGQVVGAGQIIAQLDATDAEQSLQSAELSLQNAELQYQQTTATSTLDLNLTNAQDDLTNAQTSLQKTHDTSYASLASMYTDMSSVLADLDSALTGTDSGVAGRTSEENVSAFTDVVSSHDNQIGIAENSAQTSYTTAVAAYNAALAEEQAVSLSASDDQLVTLSQQTYTAAEAVAQAVTDAHAFFDEVSTDYTLYNLGTSNELTTLLNDTNTDGTTINNDLSTALSVQSNIVSAEQALATAQNTLQTTEQGSNAITVQSAQLSLENAQQAVTTAKENLADYSVVAPFAGTIADVGVQLYDQASSGTDVATIVTNQQTLTVSVNEVDASKIQVGQKATIDFDALPNVTLAGTVASIDTIGTVSSGVVSYSIVITFDTQNPQVLPGMSATANIVSGTETGLVVPASAVKTQGSTSYVQVFSPPLANSSTTAGAPSSTAPKDVPVVVGLSGTTEVVIESGLTAGEQIVTSTIAGTSATTKSSAASATSLLGGGARAGGGFGGGGGGGFGGGGAVRVAAP